MNRMWLLHEAAEALGVLQRRRCVRTSNSTVYDPGGRTRGGEGERTIGHVRGEFLIFLSTINRSSVCTNSESQNENSNQFQ